MLVSNLIFYIMTFIYFPLTIHCILSIWLYDVFWVFCHIDS